MAKAQGSPSRAIFKLKEIDTMATNYINRKYKNKNLKGLFQPDSVVLDLGAAPGGWTKYVSERLKSEGVLIASDLLPLDDRIVTAIERNPHAPSFHLIQGDFTTVHVKNEIQDIILKNKQSEES